MICQAERVDGVGAGVLVGRTVAAGIGVAVGNGCALVGARNSTSAFRNPLRQVSS